MAKGFNKLTKFKTVLKKMQSFKLGRSSTAVTTSSDEEEYSGKNFHPVYVGKSRRRCLVSSDVMENQLFREIVERRKFCNNNNGDYGDEDEEEEGSISVGCEVVLFQHLLWMLENADLQPDSLDELVDFYVC